MSGEGDLFGRYRLLELLATGGMAQLYRAELSGPSGFSKQFVIKKILPHLSREQYFRQMFLHEGRVMAALSHRNLVTVFELDEVEGELFICLELIVGCDLSQVIKQHRAQGKVLDPFLAAWIAKEICEALEYVHATADSGGRPMGIVHRDISPKNILLSYQGDVKLGDFGIAKSAHRSVHTGQGEIKGKLRYLSPEQARGEKASASSDLYALGLVLYEMLTLKTYIQGRSEADILEFATRPTWRPMAAEQPGVPPDLEKIVQRVLRPLPEERFADARTLKRSLVAVIEQAPLTPGSDKLAPLVATISGPFPPSSVPMSSAASAMSEADRPTELWSHEPTERTTPLDRGPQAHEATASVSRPLLPLQTAETASLIDAPLTTAETASLIDAPELAEAEDPNPELRRAAGRLWLFVVSGVLGLVGLSIMAYLLVLPSQNPPPPPLAAGVDHAAANNNDDDASGEPSSPDASGPLLDVATRPFDAAAREQRNHQVVPTVVASKKKKKKKKKMQQKKRRPRRERAPRDTARDPTGAEVGAIEAQLQQQQRRLTAKGIASGDYPEIDRLLARASRQLKVKDVQAARETLAVSDNRIKNAAVDRQLVQRKMLRLQRALRRAKVEQQYKADSDLILKHVVSSRYVEANRAINRVLAKLRR